MVQEWLYRMRILAEGERLDGETAASLTARFQVNLRSRLYVAVASGLALKLVDAGLPGKCVVAGSGLGNKQGAAGPCP
jgi:hypothetical protein